jgi:hypothetical protein
MSIPQPTLDDRTYADLLAEARALIPSLAPQWTNHNPSDPGITLVELFAWLTEMLIYRVNRLPEATTDAFLQLLNGLEWRPGQDLEEDIRATVLNLRRRYRAVTAEDYEALAREASPGVARARCVPRRDLAARNEAARLVPREGFVSVVLVPDREKAGARDPASPLAAPAPSPGLLAAVRDHLEPRRLLTVRQAVVPPVYVPIQAEIVIASRPDVQAGALLDRVEAAVQGYLDPLNGGPDGEGWPFGRDVYVSELYRLLERDVPGVDYVPDITLSSTCPDDARHCVPGVELWHEEGDPIGIELSAHHLPWALIDRRRIVVGSAFLPVRVHVAVSGTAADRRAVKAAVKRLFHPLSGGPGGVSPWEITTGDIAAALAGITEDADVGLAADPARRFSDGTKAGVRFAAGEMADLTVAVERRARP